MSSSDETMGTTGEKHEPVQDGYRDHCGTCWRGVEVSAPPGEVRYRVSRALWPCENARLRERVAALTAAGTAMAEAIDAHHERLWRGSIGQASARTGLLAPRAAWHAALAQADDGGRA